MLTIVQKVRLFASEYEQIFPRNVHGMKVGDEMIIIADMLNQAADRIEELEAKPKVGRPLKVTAPEPLTDSTKQ